MRRALIMLFALALTACATAQPAPSQAQADAPWTGPSFKRMTIMVSDLDRTVRLWRDILGFEVTVNPQSGPDSYSYPVFNIARGATIRYAMVSAGPYQQRTFAFAEVKGQPIRAPQEPRLAAAVINANGRLAEIIAKVKAEGLEIVPSQPLVLQTQGTGIEQAFVDWDGHLIVLYEFPVAAPQDRR